MKKFAICKNVAYLSDVTAFGVQRDLLAKIESGEVRHIMIPDLLQPLSRKESTVNSFITMMNSLIEEGVSAMTTYATPGLVTFKKPVKVGLMTAITSDEFNDNRHNWKKKASVLIFSTKPLGSFQCRKYVMFGRNPQRESALAALASSVGGGRYSSSHEKKIRSILD
jgi:hypothetical protein